MKKKSVVSLGKIWREVSKPGIFHGKTAQMQRRDNGDEDDHSDGDSSASRDQTKDRSLAAVEKLFNFEELFEKSMSSGRTEEAYIMVKKQYHQGPQIHFAPLLVKYYSTLMQTDRPDKAVEIREKLMSLLEENVELSPDALEKYGTYLRNNEKYFEAFLFYQIAQKFCENSTDPGSVIKILHKCCGGTVEIVQEIVKNQPSLKQVLKSYFIPFMRKLYSRIGRFRYLNEKQIVYVLGVCLHCIEQSEFAVDDLYAREETLKEGIALFRQTFGSGAEERNIFGGFLNNLGHTYLLKGRPKEAARLFSQAIVAKNNAEDYGSPIEKLNDLRKSRLALGMAEESLKR